MFWVIVITFTCGMIAARLLWRKERRPFITGSFAYGESYRTASSDIDIVLLVSESTLKDLKPFCQTIQSESMDHYGTTVSAGRIKAGHVDLILVSKKRDYDHWKRITGRLKKESERRALTRPEVVETFEKDRTKMKTPMIAGPWRGTESTGPY